MATTSKQIELYRGKAKTIFNTDNPQHVLVEFRDDLTAFNKLKMGSATHKGAVNNQINAFMMSFLMQHGIKTHFLEKINAYQSLMTKVTIIPVEWVIRNQAAGSLCKRYGLTEGQKFDKPIIEFYYKDDALGDPMLNEDHIIAFGFATQSEINSIKAICLHVNDILVPFFAQHQLNLIDYKLEFGRTADHTILLADEITPDGARIWDMQTGEKLDKDRFRFDLGDVLSGYRAIAERLSIPIDTTA